MNNIKRNIQGIFDLKLSNSDYWDLCLSNDASVSIYSPATSGNCFVTHFDFDNSEIYSSGITSANTISSLIYWTGATNTGYTFNTIGLTGIDNGLVKFDKISGDSANTPLLSALINSLLIIPANNKRLILNSVSGSTNQYIYPIEIISGNSGNYAQFCGGFYQGYYKIDGSTYEVLPNRVNKAWIAQFWLIPNELNCSGFTGTTLNDTYPDNKGIFFYLGTRAENKFWNKFTGTNTGCNSGCTVDSGCTETLGNWCTTIKESDVILSGNNSNLISLSPNQVTTRFVTNPFLVYGRANSIQNRCLSCSAPSGLGNKTICTYDGKGIEITTPKTKITNTQNPFLIYGRTSTTQNRCFSCSAPSGLGNETVCSFSGFSESIQYDDIDYGADIIDNALAFRIREDGSIGYRLLTYSGICSGDTYITGTTIQEEYSISGIVESNVWSNVIIRYTMDEYLEGCDLKNSKPRSGKLLFYINGRLKFTVNNFSEIIGKRLNEYMEKQIGVPYNISIGGGSQGLIETQTFDGRDSMDLGLPIEKNFAGSFIGGISQFKFNICDLFFTDIQNIYINEVNRYYPDYTTYLLQENGFWILQENYFNIVL